MSMNLFFQNCSEVNIEGNCGKEQAKKTWKEEIEAERGSGCRLSRET